MGLRYMEAVVDNPHFTSSENGVLASLARHADNETGECFPSVSRIHEDSGLSRTVIWKQLPILESLELFKRRPRGRGMLYTLDLHQIETYSPSGPVSDVVQVRPTPDVVQVPDMVQEPVPDMNTPISDMVHEAVTKTVIEEVINTTTVPRWLEILSVDPRWPEGDLNGYVTDIEASFSGIDLVIEAQRCLAWLQTNTKGKKRKDIKATWTNWLSNHGKFDTPTPRSTERPRLSGPDRLEVMKREAAKHRST